MLIVGQRDLRAALSAVLPHVHQFPDETTHARVAFTVDDRGVNLTVSATDVYSVAAAIVSIHDVAPDLLGARFDLAPGEAKKILAVHTNRKVSKELDEEQTIGLTLSAFDQATGGASLTTRDVSGLFPGEEALTVPLLTADERSPDIPAYLGRVIRAHEGDPVAYHGEPLVVFSPRLATFHAASKAYSAPLALRVVAMGSGRALLVTCGDSFIGIVRLEVPDAERELYDEVPAAWVQWLFRLPQQPRPDSSTAWVLVDPDDAADLDDGEEPDDDPAVDEPGDPPGDAERVVNLAERRSRDD